MIISGDQCITKDCTRGRAKPNWYCVECLAQFKLDQDLRRGSVGSYPDKRPGPDPAKGDIFKKDLDRLDRELRKGNGAPSGKGGGGHEGDIWDKKRGWVKPGDGARDRWTGNGDPGPGDRDWPRPVGQGSTSTLGGGAGIHLNLNRPSCDHGGHDGRTVSLTIEGKRIYGAKGHQLNDPANVAHLNLIVDCAGLVNGTKFVAGGTNARLSRSLNMAAYPDVIRLQWPDMTAPVHVGIRFWERLLEMIPDQTCICCMGSHGRTGTAMASLLVASGMDPDKAIVEVRTQHCRRAIETPGQEAYIRGLGKERDIRNRAQALTQAHEGGTV